jgi:FkbM family methyltransferase
MPENHLLPDYPTIRIPMLLKLLRHVDFPHKKGIMYRLFGKGLSRQGIGWASTWTGIEWLIDATSPTDQWMVYDRYADSHFLKWAEQNVAPDACIIDSGSNIGQFLPYFSKLVPKGNVIGFEPSSELHAWVQACIDRSDIKNIEIIHKGLGELVEIKQLLLIEYENTHGIWNSIVSEGGYEPVEITSLSAFLSAQKIDEVALWKLDVEGYEIPALKGAADLFLAKKIKAAYIEVIAENDNHIRIIELMQTYHYLPFLFKNKGLVPLVNIKDLDKMDVLFLPA